MRAVIFMAVLLAVFVALLYAVLAKTSGKYAQKQIREERVMTPEACTEVTQQTPIPSLDDPQERASEEMMEDSDLYWLARTMQEEGGPNWPDAFVMMIGEVVLNRVEHDGFPNTVKEVVLQEGQYEPFFPPFERFTPEQRYIRLARRLMTGERIIDDPDVIWQALFPQGSQTVVTVYDEDLQTTTYFCK